MSTDVLSLYYQNPFVEESNFLGKGAFGSVFRLFNKLDNRYYAVKRILITEKSISSALKEIRILASLSHPNIVRYFNSWIESKPYDAVVEEMRQDDDTYDSHTQSGEEDVILRVSDSCYYFNIQMECCDRNLRTILRERTHVDMTWCYQTLCQVIEGLSFLHKNLIVHRDLKPDNILFVNDRVKIGDFGLAKIFTPLSNNDQGTTYAGTCLYAAPEQFQSGSYSYASDIYSLGILFFEIQFVFTTDMERILMINNLKKTRIADHHLLHYKDMIVGMLDPDPTRRPSITMIRNYFDPVLFHPAIMCRDILWEIISSLPLEK